MIRDVKLRAELSAGYSSIYLTLSVRFGTWRDNRGRHFWLGCCWFKSDICLRWTNA